jgi:hypothetical protein
MRNPKTKVVVIVACAAIVLSAFVTPVLAMASANSAQYLTIKIAPPSGGTVTVHHRGAGGAEKSRTCMKAKCTFTLPRGAALTLSQKYGTCFSFVSWKVTNGGKTKSVKTLTLKLVISGNQAIVAANFMGECG